jgi:lipopolysaccharide transport system ATP-binding protein
VTTTRLRSRGLGKAYRLYRRPFDSLKELLLRRSYAEIVWALKGVDIQVDSERSLGIVGDNGAGKSTLLKLLAGAIAPTTGSVERSGRVASILSLGAGFHPDLSGLENIRIGCAVLGLTPAETNAVLPEIVAFSELEGYLDRPVKTYSSGMYLRLGFSVATAVRPEILIIDEHLAVGDQHFRLKCKRRILDLKDAGSTIVFCSHDLHSVLEVCDETLWLRGGEPVMVGGSQEVLNAYQDHVWVRNQKTEAEARDRNPKLSPNFLREVTLGGDFREGEIRTGGRLELRVLARLTEGARQDGVLVAVLLVRSDALRCYGVTTRDDDVPGGLYHVGGDDYGVTFVIDPLPLLSGTYTFTVALQDTRSPHTYDHRSGACSFRVRHEGREVGVARFAHRWEMP